MNFRNSISSPARILVVDDHPHTAQLLARALSQLGPQVTVASATSAQDALAWAPDGGVDVLITDMNMPGMTGLELIAEFQKRGRRGPAVSVLLTASHVPAMKIEARRLHVREVLYKPIHPQKIYELVRQALQEIEECGSYEDLETQKKRFKILIADDEPDHVTVLSRFMEGEGYACITAQNGREALERIGHEQPDLILLDANMPDKDGFTVVRELRANPAAQDIPVILLSASWDSAVGLNEAWNLEPDDFFSKPIHRYNLLTRIRKKLLKKETQYANIDRSNN